jgi:hypothetical protein
MTNHFPKVEVMNYLFKVSIPQVWLLKIPTMKTVIRMFLSKELNKRLMKIERESKKIIKLKI